MLIHVRRVELLLVAASIGLVALMVWHWQRWLPGQTAPATSTRTPPVDLAVSQKAKTANGRKAKNFDRSSAASRAPELSGDSFSPDPVPATTAVKPLLDIPDSKTMAIGTTRSDLRKRYGIPSAVVTSLRDGHLVELYYYVKPDRANMVVATLREGKLVSAQDAIFWQPQRNLAAQ